MKVQRILVLATFCLAVIPVALSAREPSKGVGTPVDSGSFGVFINGHRVATETFSILQTTSGSVISSEFKAEQGQEPADQSSELQLNNKGELLRYEWKELVPGQTRAVVTPKDDFLIETVTNKPGDKILELPFMIPSSTSILDDYFFVQREVLAWKFLALGCRQKDGAIECPKDQKTHFGALNPHGRESQSVSMEFSGNEKLTIHGTERAVSRYTLKSDSGDWTLWLDDHHMLVRIVVVADNTTTEVLRD